MEKTRFPIFKSRPMRPFLHTQLATSTPYSHQVSKRIKGLLAYSEHYKGSCLDYPKDGSRFPPFQARDYRKARELTLDIWDPMIKTPFLKKFLRSQKNLHTIRIRVFTKGEYKEELLERLCEILCKVNRLNSVHIEFDKWPINQIMPSVLQKVRSLRLLPKLKDLAIGFLEERAYLAARVCPFSVSLLKVGFNWVNNSLVMKDTSIIQKFMNKTPKFNQLSTIRIDCRKFFVFPDQLLDALVFIISKLPNFRELDFNYPKDLRLSMKQTLKVLDTLAKAPKFELLRIGFQMKGISLLKHPLFKAKSLKRTHLSLYFHYSEITIQEFSQILHLLQAIPSLHQLSMNFPNYENMSDEIIEGFMKKISEMTSIRKLEIIFEYSETKLGAKQIGNIVRSIFNMQHLEELDLQLPKSGLDLGGHDDIQGLPRLQRTSIPMSGWGAERENDIKGMLEILGKCHRLKELELWMIDSVYDYPGVTRKLCENLMKLKRLQVLKLCVFSVSEASKIGPELLENLAITFDRMRCLQDLSFSRILDEGLCRQLARNPKYRFLDLGS